MLLNSSTTEEIAEYIVNVRRNANVYHPGSKPTLIFHWEASQVHSLADELDTRLLEIDQQKIYRFEYDYVSNTVFIKIGESRLNGQVQNGLRNYLQLAIKGLLNTTNNQRLSKSLQPIVDWGTARVDLEGKLLKHPDASYGTKTAPLPFLVCEIS